MKQRDWKHDHAAADGADDDAVADHDDDDDKVMKMKMKMKIIAGRAHLSSRPHVAARSTVPQVRASQGRRSQPRWRRDSS